MGRVDEMLRGSDGRYSLRRVIAAITALDFLFKSTAVIAKYVADGNAPPAEVTMLLGLDIGLIGGCLAFTTWQNNIEIKNKGSETPN